LGKILLENLESFGIPEKTRHADQRVRIEGAEFFGIALQENGVVLQVI